MQKCLKIKIIFFVLDAAIASRKIKSMEIKSIGKFDQNVPIEIKSIKKVFCRFVVSGAAIILSMFCEF